MNVIIGGSGSTGSSLLKNILNRSESVYSGEESNLFCKKELYTSFQNHKFRIIRRGLMGLKNYGWHIYNGIDITDNGYPIDLESLKSIIEVSDGFQEFINHIRDHFELKEDKIWLEKTPANACNFADFLHHIDNGKIIHIVRNPYDTVSSLVQRGYDLYYACGIYIINTAAGLAHVADERCYTIKYEDLTNTPNETLPKLCHWLGITYEPSMLASQGEKLKVSKLEGWQYDETEDVAKPTQSRFNELNIEKQKQIIGYLNHMTVSSAGKKRYKIIHSTIEEICIALGYEYRTTADAIPNEISQELRKDRLKRLLRGYSTALHYPISIKP